MAQSETRDLERECAVLAWPPISQTSIAGMARRWAGGRRKGVIQLTRAARPEEYQGLLKELTGRPYGYRLRIVRRR